MERALKRTETAAHGVRRIVRQRLEQVIRRLSQRPLPDAAIHRSRKELKKTRAGLRLLRDALGEHAYSRANRQVRDAARPLSVIRDARALIDQLNELARRPSARLPAAGVAALRAVLESERRAVRRRLVIRHEELDRALAALRALREESGEWRVGRRGWPVLGCGLRRVYRAGRAAGEVARRYPTAANLHEWRKQVKYLWYQLQILEPARPRTLGRWIAQARELGDTLGDDHDFAVLKEKLAHVPQALPDAQARARLEGAIDARRGALEEKALALGRRVYRAKPREFAERLGRYVRDWQRTRV
ncbi:MAG TPA: CHAD domain-containing protein [Steroidobacteraceae bacterium]|nr:CHAD domain-containing protein [Steroidobacteraceae bacterium]